MTLAAVLVFLLLTASMLYVYHYLKQEMVKQAESAVSQVIGDIEDMLSRTAVVPENAAWVVKDNIRKPQEMFDITRKVVSNNDRIVGCAVAFESRFYPSKGHWFSPYSFKRADGTVSTIQMGGEDYDYFSMEWYTQPLSLGKSCWSEPYYDEGGGEMLMTTRSVPVADEQGHIYAVVTSDISLDTLSGMLSSIVPYEGAHAYLLSKKGIFVSHPDPEWIMKKSFRDMATDLADDRVIDIGEKMLAGESGSLSFQMEDRTIKFVVYAPLSNGWSLALVCPFDRVFSILGRINRVIWLFLLLIAALLYFAIRYIRKTTMSKQRMESELSIASEIQNEMLAKNFPQAGPVDLYAMLQPARETGGDLYDFYVKEDRVYISVGDVSGKGVPAALFMAITRSVVRFIAGLGFNPEQVVNRINRTFCASNTSSMFVTLFVATIDLRTLEMEFCNAGHNPIVVLEPGKPARFLHAKTNIAAGLMEDFGYQGETLTLSRGTSLLLYTDGVTEAENIEHEQYGEQRLLDFCNKISSGMTAKEVVTELHQSVRDFADIAPQNDDITILYVKL